MYRNSLSLVLQHPRVYEGLPPDAEKENLLKQSLDYLDNLLGSDNEGNPGTPYLTGDAFTIADLAILASLTELDAMDYVYKCYGDLNRWAARLRVSVARLSVYSFRVLSLCRCVHVSVCVRHVSRNCSMGGGMNLSKTDIQSRDPLQ